MRIWHVGLLSEILKRIIVLERVLKYCINKKVAEANNENKLSRGPQLQQFSNGKINNVDDFDVTDDAPMNTGFPHLYSGQNALL